MEDHIVKIKMQYLIKKDQMLEKKVKKHWHKMLDEYQRHTDLETKGPYKEMMSTLIKRGRAVCEEDDKEVPLEIKAALWTLYEKVEKADKKPGGKTHLDDAYEKAWMWVREAVMTLIYPDLGNEEEE